MTALETSLGLLGPLEGRIMSEIWSKSVPDGFVVRDVQKLMPELAYTTVMTTLNRLVDKGLLDVKAIRGQRAHAYHVAAEPEQFVARTSRERVEQVVEQFGEAAIVAFAERLNRLSPEQLRRLQELGRS